MKSTPTPRFYIQRLFLLTLVCSIAVAALVGIVGSANKANRAAKIREAQAVASKSAIIKNSVVQQQGPQAPNVPSISASLVDSFPVHPSGKANPGDTITYTATITNTGTDATGMTFTDVLDANTTQTGTVNVSPVTLNDTYPQTVIGNVSINSALIPFSVLTNDYMGQNPAGTITAFSPLSAQGGNVVVNADGTFTYNPPPGYEGADTFTYTLSNSTGSSIGTVSLTISGMVWFINNNSAACTTLAGGCGRLSNPFSTLAAFNTLNNGTGNNPAVNDNIFLYQSATLYTGPVTLLGGQKLIGQDATASLATITGLTPPTGSAQFPAMDAAAPATTINSSVAAVNAVNLNAIGTSNTVRGMTVTTGSNTSKGINGASFGTLTTADLILSGSGPALDLSTGALSGSFNSISSSGGVNGIKLNAITGSSTLGTGALSGASAEEFLVTGGTVTLTYDGTISTTTAASRPVSISNKTTSGNVTFNGAVSASSSASGVNLDNNDGATITFRGGLALTTTTNTAFNAINGGTVEVCDENPCVPGATGALVNTLTTTTGAALIVTGTTISSNKLEFRSISVTGNNTLPASGIVLSTTGATGGLKVVGNGGACTPATPTCTGGTIQGTGSHGISLTSVSNIEFNLMSIHNTGDHGIFGDGVNNFTFRDSRIFNFGNTAGGAVSEDAMHFESTNIANTAAGHGLTGTVILQRDNIGPDSGSFVRTPNPPIPENKGLVVRNHNDVDVNITVTGTKFLQISNDGIDADIRNETDATAGHGTGTLNVDGSTADGANDFNNINGRSINFVQPVDSAAARIFELTIKNNTFTSVGIGGRWMASGRGTMNARYNNNTMATTSDDAIRSESDAVNGALTPHASVNATINGNTMGGGSIFISLHRQALSNIAFTNNTNLGGTAAGAGGCATCTGVHTGVNLRSDRGSALGIDFVSNTGTADGSLAFAQSALDMQATTNGGGNSTICARVMTNNLTESPDTAGQQVISIDPVGGSTITIEGGPGGSPGTENFLIANNTLNGSNKVAISTPGAVPSGVAVNCVTSTPTAPSFEAGVKKVNAPDGSFLTTAVAASVPIPVKDQVAETVKAPELIAKQDAPIVSDSLSGVKAVHAIESERSDVRLSHHAIRRNNNNTSSDQKLAPLSGETIGPITIGTLPAGKSVIIVYQAIVNTPPTTRLVSTQGTVHSTTASFADVLTDDPAAGGATDPTTTPIDTTITWTGATDTNWNVATNWTVPGPVVSTYAPGVSNPAINDVIIPNVGNQPTIGTTDIGIYSLNLSNGRTLTITNPRVLTIGGSPGGDLTLDGIISGGFLNLGTGAHAINNAGGTGSLSSTNVATVLSGSTVTLNNTLQAGALAVNTGGSMTIAATRTLSLNGSGAALAIGAGATFTATGSTVVFNGTAAQTSAGATFNNLTINNSIGLNVTGVTLTGNAIVNGALALTSSDLDTAGFTLTQPNTTASTGVSDVVGTVIRSGGPFPLGPLTFGNPNNIINFTGAGTRPTTMTVVLAKAAPSTYAAAVQRNYSISQTAGSGFTATVRLHYLDSELNGNLPETSLGLRRLRTSDSHWVAAPPPPGVPTRDGAANWVEATGVLAADLTTQWTFSTLAPTAAGGVITGRIVDNDGHAVEGAVVRLEGTQNRKFITDANGVYRFENVETNGFYTVTPSRANYTFNPQARSFSQIGETTEATFGATVETSNLLNPLDTPEYFVRQHYIDFLGREPDEAGFNYWSDEIIGCGLDQDCIGRKRENVSAAYFLSIEFQTTGGLVDGLYRAAYGARPQFNQFMPDTRTVAAGVVVGRDGWQTKLQANKEAFVADFANRPAFHALYDGMDSSLFVDTMIRHTGVSFTASERDALIGMTRAEALRTIAENERFVSAKFNDTFVMMEYFGYLRRDADAAGFQYWLDKLNQFDGNFEQAEMVKAFIVSGEYRDRFPK